jgi:DNA polymerase-3 subunit epsilon
MSGSTPWHLQPIAVLDTETTGLSADQGDRVVEIGVARFDKGESVDTWGSLVDPECPLPKDTTRITGIRPEDIAGQPTFAAVADEFLGRIEGRLLVAYNAAFDRAFIIEELARAGKSLPDGSVWIDPLVFAKEIQRGQGNMKLVTVAKRLGIELDAAHRATADAECTGKVLLALAGDLPDTLDELIDLQERWEAKQNAERAAWRSRRPRGATQQVMQDFDGPKNSLGPRYPHSDETDPVRHMFLRGTGRC